MFTGLCITTLLLSSPIRLLCPESQQRAIRVDGITNEWAALAPLVLGKGDVIKGKEKIRGKTDLGVAIRCSYVKNEGLFFLIEVTDSRIIGARRPNKKHDHFTLSLTKRHNKITVYPPYRNRKGVVKGLPKKARARVIKLEYGYAIELGIPWGKMGLTYGASVTPVNFTLYDTDSALLGKPETIITLDHTSERGMTRLEHGGARRLMSSFLDRLSLDTTDVKIDRVGNFIKGSALERLVYGGRYLGILGGDAGVSFFYIPLANNAESVQKVNIIDVDGDNLNEILTVFTYANGSSTWKVLAIYRVTPKGIKRLFAHMLGFQNGEHFITNSYTLKRRRKKYHITFHFKGASKTITKKTWRGQLPDRGVENYLFPWGPKKETFLFAKGSYTKK